MSIARRRLLAVACLATLGASARAQFDAYTWTLQGDPASNSFVQGDTMWIECDPAGLGSCDARYVTTAPATGTYVVQLDAHIQLGFGAYTWRNGTKTYDCTHCTTTLTLDVQAGDEFGFGVDAFDFLFANAQFSGLQFVGVPQISAIEPTLAHLDEPLTITGHGFGAFTTVTVNGQPEPVLSFSATELVIQPGPHDPGFASLAVLNEGVAADADHDGLVFAPAFACEPLESGGTAELTLQRGAASAYVLLLGAERLPAPVPVGLHLYGLALDPGAPLVTLLIGTTPGPGPLELFLPMPDDLALAGLPVHLQAWTGAAPGAPSSFTNAVTRVIAQPAPAARLTLADAQAVTDFGADFVRVGDLDGDGQPDYVVGSPGYRPTLLEFNVGRVTGHSGVDGSLLFTRVGHELNGYFGRTLDVLGDVDGDGLDDVVVSEYGSGNVHVLSGADGSSIHVLPLPHWDVAGLDDLDGDGVPEILVGNGIVDASEASVLSGATGALLRHHPGVPGDAFGHAVADAGDVDGDGTGDYIIGAPHNGSSQTAQSFAAVFSGATGASLHVLRGASSNHLGDAVAGAGDVNGDGHADLIVGAPTPNIPGWPGLPVGYVRVYSGADGSVLYQFLGGSGAVLPGMAPLEEDFGLSVAGAGDVNGDGVPDLIVGIPRSAHPQADGGGEARVYSGAQGTLLFRLVGAEPNARAGRVVRNLGDGDGDGLAEVGVTASVPSQSLLQVSVH